MSVKCKKVYLHNTAYDGLREMLSKHKVNLKVNEIQIIESKKHYFDYYRNIIGIRTFELKTLFDHTASLHEGGHYLSLSQNVTKRKMFSYSLTLISINRIIIIPLFLILAYIYSFSEGQIKVNFIIITIALVFFVIASILRLSIGMFEEYRASRIAFDYMQKHYTTSAIKYAKRFLIISFYNHLFLTLVIIIVIPLIYGMIYG